MEILNLNLEQITLIIGISTSIAIPLILYFVLRTERSIKKQELLFRWADQYQKHSELIVRNIFEGWNKNSGVLASLTFDASGPSYKEPREPGAQPFDLAGRHLQEGYPAIWNLYQDAKKESVELSNQMLKLMKSYEQMIIEKIIASCPEFRIIEKWVTPMKIRVIYNPGLLAAVLYAVTNRLKGWYPGSFNTSSSNIEVVDDRGKIARKDITDLTFSVYYVGRGEEDDVEKLKFAVQNLMVNPDIAKIVEEYHKLSEMLQQSGRAAQFDKEVRALLGRVLAGETLKGSCDLCPKKPT